MNGKPDTLKGSYYANPIGESNEASGEEKKEFPEYYGKNICGWMLKASNTRIHASL